MARIRQRHEAAIRAAEAKIRGLELEEVDLTTMRNITQLNARCEDGWQMPNVAMWEMLEKLLARTRGLIEDKQEQIVEVMQDNKWRDEEAAWELYRIMPLFSNNKGIMPSAIVRWAYSEDE